MLRISQWCGHSVVEWTYSWLYSAQLVINVSLVILVTLMVLMDDGPVEAQRDETNTKKKNIIQAFTTTCTCIYVALHVHNNMYIDNMNVINHNL